MTGCGFNVINSSFDQRGKEQKNCKVARSGYNFQDGGPKFKFCPGFLLETKNGITEKYIKVPNLSRNKYRNHFKRLFVLTEFVNVLNCW